MQDRVLQVGAYTPWHCRVWVLSYTLGSLHRCFQTFLHPLGETAAHLSPPRHKAMGEILCPWILSWVVVSSKGVIMGIAFEQLWGVLKHVLNAPGAAQSPSGERVPSVAAWNATHYTPCSSFLSHGASHHLQTASLTQSCAGCCCDCTHSLAPHTLGCPCSLLGSHWPCKTHLAVIFLSWRL